MRIGIMLRHYDQHGGGVRVYTHRTLRAMLDLRTAHEFVFLYNNPELVGTYAADTEVTEVALPGENILWWDQIEVPRAIKKHRIDVLYNPKYSLPLRASCPTAWVCHGLDWYVMPWASRRIDRLSHKFLVPRYARKADAIIAVSEVTREHVIEFLPIPAERVFTVYSGVDDSFRHSAAPEARVQLKSATICPRDFFFTPAPSIRRKISPGSCRRTPRLGLPPESVSSSRAERIDFSPSTSSRFPTKWV